MKTKTTKKTEPYIASIKILGRTYTSKGKTLTEALGNLKIEGLAKSMSIVTVSKGDKSVSKVIPRPQTFRLLNSSNMMKEVVLKNIALMFNI